MNKIFLVICHLPPMASTLIFHLALFLLLVLPVPELCGATSIGVCYVNTGDNLPQSADVIETLHAHEIQRVRLYEPVVSDLQALQNSNISVALGMNNVELQGIASYQFIPSNWVVNNVEIYVYEMTMDYLVVGNEAIPGGDSPYVLTAMQNLYNTLKDRELQNKVKVTTAVSSAVLSPYDRPSAARFNDESQLYMESILRYLAEIGSPLLANVHPYRAYVSNPRNIPLQYALFDNEHSPVLSDGPYEYNNLFDTMLDAFYVALEKVNVTNVRIVVSATGWPTAGSYGASVNNAETYNSRLIEHVSSSRGTPRRREIPIEAYLYSLFDENSTKVDGHWGIFSTNQEPIYNITFL